MIKNTYFSIGKTNRFFKKEYIYSESKFGPIVISNKISPISGSAISIKNNNAIKKSLSEAVERRILMQPIISNKKYRSYDLITGSKGWVDSEKLGYAINIDSTGTASHTNVEKAIIHALEELLEKNALMRIWYKKEIFNISQIGWEPDYPFSKNTIFLLNTFFFPFLTVVSACKDEKGFWHCGLGCALNDLNKAKKSSYEEMKLLWHQDNTYKSFARNYDYVEKHVNLFTYYKWDNSQLLYMDEVVKNALPYLKKMKFEHKSLTLKSIGKQLSKKINHLNVIFFFDSLFKGTEFSVRCISNELISSIPTKKVCEKKIKSDELHLITLKDLNVHPECPII